MASVYPLGSLEGQALEQLCSLVLTFEEFNWDLHPFYLLNHLSNINRAVSVARSVSGVFAICAISSPCLAVSSLVSFVATLSARLALARVVWTSIVAVAAAPRLTGDAWKQTDFVFVVVIRNRSVEPAEE